MAGFFLGGQTPRVVVGTLVWGVTYVDRLPTDSRRSERGTDPVEDARRPLGWKEEKESVARRRTRARSLRARDPPTRSIDAINEWFFLSE